MLIILVRFITVFCFCLATLRAQAAKIEADNELHRLTQARELELSYSKSVSELEIEKARRLADIETQEFKEHVSAIGAKTIQAIATSGPDNQVRLNFYFNYLINPFFLG
jgi:major vault protein